MNQYLTPEQRALFERELSGDALTEEEKSLLREQGMRMAQEKFENRGDEALLEENGFDSAAELLDAYVHAQRELNDLRDVLARLTAVSKAMKNGEELAPGFRLRRAHRPELEPLYEREKSSARNRLIQSEWKKRAQAMGDLREFLPEMAEYILAHPAYALEEDGLERAYDAVRARHYRSEDAMLADPEFVSRLAQDDRIKHAVLTAHLAEIWRSGRDIPATIGNGGNTPAAERGKQGMQQAKSRLTALLARG